METSSENLTDGGRIASAMGVKIGWLFDGGLVDATGAVASASVPPHARTSTWWAGVADLLARLPNSRDRGIESLLPLVQLRNKKIPWVDARVRIPDRLRLGE